MGYKLITDVNCDLPLSYTKRHDVKVLPFAVTIEGKSYVLTNDPDASDNIDIKWFYDKLREGVPATTSQTNVSDYLRELEPILQSGEDVLCLVLSSGLSGAFNSANTARTSLLEKYPDRKIYIVDSLRASGGQGLLLDIAVRKRDEGLGIDELNEYLNTVRHKIFSWFTVDDLNHLKRGGRVSSTSAFIGTMLNIKPVLCVDQEGHLIPREKHRGRKRAFKSFMDHYEAESTNRDEFPVFLTHGDCEDEALLVAQMFKEQFGMDVKSISMIGPVIGSHSGPGTIAFFFYGEGGMWL